MNVTSTFFTHNRQSLTRQQPGGVYVLAGYGAQQRSGDMAQTFLQEANFWWLTGIEEPGWEVVIDGASAKTWLVAPARDDVHVLFDGGLSYDAARLRSGADEVVSPRQARELLAEYAAQGAVVYTLGKDPRASHYDFVLNTGPESLRRRVTRQFTQVEDCRLALAKLRAIKQPVELAAIEQAIALTAEAFTYVKSRLSTLRYEHEVQAEFDYYFKKHGATHAYEPIVAGGERAVTLHYSANNHALSDGLLLLDIGARVDGFAADITRTYSIGTPTQRQRDVHAAVADAHREIIALLGPGVSVEEYHRKVDAIMRRTIEGLGLPATDYQTYFPHAISHGLGIDVHDSLGRPTEFAPGMVLTVEPGFYSASEGIGVRIEDDIVITETGARNLSHDLSIEL